MSDTKKLGYCLTCGDSLWEGIDHQCEKPHVTVERKKMNPLVAQMLDALVLAEIEMSRDSDRLEPGRALAAVRRVLWRLEVTPDEKDWARIQTTAEACPPASWD